MEETKTTDYKSIFDMWRNRAFTTNEELKTKVIEYFTSWHTIRKYYDKKRESMVEVPVLTITGLSLFLGFADRRSFYDYEKRWKKTDATEEEELISHTLKRARGFIEKEYEEQLQTWSAAWAIFALKNFDWKDTQTIEGELNDNGSWKMVVEYLRAKHENIPFESAPLQIEEEIEE